MKKPRTPEGAAAGFPPKFYEILFFSALLCVILYAVFLGGFSALTEIERGIAMANRVVVTICGEDYTFVAEESTAYTQKVASYVDEKMTEVLNSIKVGRTDAAILTAANITDELFKAQTASEQLRSQIKGYLDAAGKAQAEASELKREVFRLQQKLEGKNR